MESWSHGHMESWTHGDRAGFERHEQMKATFVILPMVLHNCLIFAVAGIIDSYDSMQPEWHDRENPSVAACGPRGGALLLMLESFHPASLCSKWTILRLGCFITACEDLADCTPVIERPLAWLLLGSIKRYKYYFIHPSLPD